MTLAPLVLGGCFLPLGVQVASMIADGVSLATTDKTIADHGLSAITNQDCALWRIVNGEQVCSEVAPDEGFVMVADADTDGTIESENLAPVIAPVIAPAIAPVIATANGLVDAGDNNPTGSPEIATETAGLAPMEAPAKPPLTPAAPAAPASVITSGGTFFVVASFSRLDGAKRFARRHAALAMQVLAGAANGKTVYRVAAGPVDRAGRLALRAKLADGGLHDAWPLTVKAATIVELAALN
ncbi:MAG: SPOR domain-containing protein [Proteobacteria bacterium]|nr:SPOR domain-containing protein [Pseudomonadota bacterium]